jgi:hypothetical protein
MKKMYLIPMLAIFGVALAFAGVYVVNNFVIQSDVYEPYTVSYAILGDAGNYEGGACSDVTEWTLMEDVTSPFDVQGLFAGESRRFCVKIDNEGEGNVPYVITSVVQEGDNYEACTNAFPKVTETGTATGSATTYDGVTFTVASDAEPVEDCLVEVSVGRGELE